MVDSSKTDIFTLIKQAKASWNKGEFVLIHDSSNREDEVDIMLPSDKVEPRHIALMRTLGGGLICTAVTHEFAHAITLPFMKTILNRVSGTYPLIQRLASHELPYGARSSFSITVNHVKAFTGITDVDRALTISTLGKLSADFANQELDAKELFEAFSSSFRSPGHVHILRAANQLLIHRQGHTELGLALTEITGQAPSVTMVEMMDPETFKRLSMEKAMKISEKYGWPILEADDIVKMWRNVKGIPREKFKVQSM